MTIEKAVCERVFSPERNRFAQQTYEEKLGEKHHGFDEN